MLEETKTRYFVFNESSRIGWANTYDTLHEAVAAVNTQGHTQNEYTVWGASLEAKTMKPEIPKFGWNYR